MSNHDILPFTSEALDENKQLISAGSCWLRGWTVGNPGNAVAYLQLFDAASTAEVTLGTTVAKVLLPIASGGNVQMPVHVGVLFAKGIVAAQTANLTDATAPNADGAGTIFYSKA